MRIIESYVPNVYEQFSNKYLDREGMSSTYRVKDQYFYPFGWTADTNFEVIKRDVTADKFIVRYEPSYGETLKGSLYLNFISISEEDVAKFEELFDSSDSLVYDQNLYDDMIDKETKDTIENFFKAHDLDMNDSELYDYAYSTAETNDAGRFVTLDEDTILEEANK